MECRGDRRDISPIRQDAMHTYVKRHNNSAVTCTSLTLANSSAKRKACADKPTTCRNTHNVAVKRSGTYINISYNIYIWQILEGSRQMDSLFSFFLNVKKTIWVPVGAIKPQTSGFPGSILQYWDAQTSQISRPYSRYTCDKRSAYY